MQLQLGTDVPIYLESQQQLQQQQQRDSGETVALVCLIASRFMIIVRFNGVTTKLSSVSSILWL